MAKKPCKQCPKKKCKNCPEKITDKEIKQIAKDIEGAVDDLIAKYKKPTTNTCGAAVCPLCDWLEMRKQNDGP